MLSSYPSSLSKLEPFYSLALSVYGIRAVYWQLEYCYPVGKYQVQGCDTHTYALILQILLIALNKHNIFTISYILENYIKYNIYNDGRKSIVHFAAALRYVGP